MAVKIYRTVVVGAVVLAAVSLLGFLAASPASATDTVAWAISSYAEPTHFSPNDAERCRAYVVCDGYQLVVRNVGDTASSGAPTPLMVTDKLPSGITTVGASPPKGRGWTCTMAVTSIVECTYSTPVAPEAQAQVLKIPVTAPSASTGTLNNEVLVAGGGAEATAVTSEETVISTERPPFELTDFGFNAIDTKGGPSLQAGRHPSDVTASFDVSDVFRANRGNGSNPVVPVENLRQVIVELPADFVGDPQATARCPEYDLSLSECPPNSRIGVVTFDGEGSIRTTTNAGSGTSAIYNMVPEAGYPAEFAFTYAGNHLTMYAAVIHTASGYRLRVSSPGVPAAIGIVGVSLTFFGDPAALDESGGAPTAFLTNPADCVAGPFSARIEADSWENPGRWVAKESTTYPQVEDCNLLQFEPKVEMTSSPSGEEGSSQADEPSAYNVNLEIPQKSLFEEAATPDLKNAIVTLPQGVSVSPSAADGLEGCAEHGPNGIDIANDEGRSPDEAGEGEEIGADSLSRLAAGHCPAASTLGTAEVFTPLLPTRCGGGVQPACKPGESPAPLQGHVYLAQPKCGGAGQPECTEASVTNGELFGLYIEAEGSGVIVKLPGTVAANPQTGQLTATFQENPQLPFSDLKLHFHGGPRAPLANPQSCGSFATISTLTSWGGQEASGSSPAFGVDWDGKGGACPASLPFSPGFAAGTTTPSAGAFSPFTLTFSRNDREQDLAGLSVTLPPGLLGKIAGIPLCGEAQANAGTCGPESQIGSASVLAGPGTDPLYVSGGRVYLTTGYKGQPFGLSIVVPAVAGPFNLGYVVVRASIHVNPETSQITVTTDTLPQSKDGVPFRLRTVYSEINRAGGFTFNATNCAQQQITGTITGMSVKSGEASVSASVSSPYSATGCASLPFKPSFTVSTQGKTSKADGASLVVRVAQKPGEANIQKVDLTLPKLLPSRLTTLQKACTEAQFNANPAGCPEASVIGTATANTPVLPVSLTGPAYLVSHGGAAFPDVEFILQGDGVEIVLDGKTDIKNGITYSKFEAVPDAPIVSFETVLPEGPHSVLGTNLPPSANYSLCGQSLAMPTTITGQNGSQVSQTTKIAVTACAKPEVKIKRARAKGDAVLVTVTVSQPGSVTITGNGLRTLKKALAAGTHQLKLVLTKHGRTARKQHRKAKLQVTLKNSVGSSRKATTLRL